MALYDWSASAEGAQVLESRRVAQRLRMIAVDAWSFRGLPDVAGSIYRFLKRW